MGLSTKKSYIGSHIDKRSLAKQIEYIHSLMERRKASDSKNCNVVVDDVDLYFEEEVLES